MVLSTEVRAGRHQQPDALEAGAAGNRCYQLQANSYLRKPVEFAEFENLVLSINDFWLRKAMLPSMH